MKTNEPMFYYFLLDERLILSKNMGGKYDEFFLTRKHFNIGDRILYGAKQLSKFEDDIEQVWKLHGSKYFWLGKICSICLTHFIYAENQIYGQKVICYKCH